MIRIIFTGFFSLVLTVGCAKEANLLRINGGQLAYSVYGNQPDTMVLINGGPGMNSAGFEPLAEVLSQWVTVILYDQRGTGKSTLERIDSTTISMEFMVQDLEHLRKHLGMESWIVMGHSFGGMLGSLYATAHPNRVQKLILSSSGGLDLSLLDGYRIFDHLTQTEIDSFHHYNDLINAGDTSFQTNYLRSKQLAPAYLHHADKVHDIALRLTQVNRTINRLLWEGLRTMNFDCKKRAASFTDPVLILQGKNDILSTTIAEESAAIFPDCHLVLMDECAHYGWLDQPKLYFKSIQEFLNGSL